MAYLHRSSPQALSFVSAEEKQNTAKEREGEGERDRSRGSRREWFENGKEERDREVVTDWAKESKGENKLSDWQQAVRTQAWGWRMGVQCSLLCLCSYTPYSSTEMKWYDLNSSSIDQAHGLLMCCTVRHISSDAWNQYCGLCISHLSVVLGYASDETDSEEVIMQITDSIKALLDLKSAHHCQWISWSRHDPASQLDKHW